MMPNNQSSPPSHSHLDRHIPCKNLKTFSSSLALITHQDPPIPSSLSPFNLVGRSDDEDPCQSPVYNYTYGEGDVDDISLITMDIELGSVLSTLQGLSQRLHIAENTKLEQLLQRMSDPGASLSSNQYEIVESIDLYPETAPIPSANTSEKKTTSTSTFTSHPNPMSAIKRFSYFRKGRDVCTCRCTSTQQINQALADKEEQIRVVQMEKHKLAEAMAQVEVEYMNKMHVMNDYFQRQLKVRDERINRLNQEIRSKGRESEGTATEDRSLTISTAEV